MFEKETNFNIAFRRPFFASFILTCLYFFLGWAFFTPFFQTNDDMVMNWITQGVGMVDHPSEFLILVNVLLGLLLKQLNLWLPQVPWYGLSLYALLFLSTWGLMAAFFSGARSSWGILLFFPVETPVFFHCYAWPQYTVYCFLIAQAGVFLFASPFRPHGIAFSLAGFLLVMASLIRLEPALFTLGIAAFFLIKVHRAEQDRLLEKNRIRAFCITAFFILSGVGFNHYYVSVHPGWAEAREYYDKRFSIGEIKVTNYDHQAEAFQAVGWSQVDYEAFVDGCYEGEPFSLDRLKKLDGLLHVDLGIKRKMMGVLFLNPLVQFLLVGLAVALGIGIKTKNPALLPVFWVLLLTAGLFTFNKIVARALWPQIFFVDLILAFWLPGGSLFFRRWIPVLLTSALGVCAFFTLREDYVNNRPGPLARRAITESLQALHPREDQLFIIWGSSFPFVGFPIFEPYDHSILFRFLWMWWLEKSPYGEKQLAQFHIQDFLKDTVDRPDIFWLMKDDSHTLEDYFMEKKGMKVARKLVFHGYFDVYQIRTLK